jgi:hypothetical protein
MDCKSFYKQLFKPVEERIGPIDAKTMVALIGFDCGGPLNICTVGRGRDRFVTYLSCELALRHSQKTGDAGPFEVMMVCDNEHWIRNMLTRIGRMSFESVFESGDTIDVGQVVESNCPVQGLVVEEFARVRIDGRSHAILLFHGVTRAELEFAMSVGSDELLDRLKRTGVYPRTSIYRRESIETKDKLNP